MCFEYRFNAIIICRLRLIFVHVITQRMQLAKHNVLCDSVDNDSSKSLTE